MNLAAPKDRGLALGAWGAAQATAAGLAIAASGLINDLVGGLAQSGALGETLSDPAVGYAFVYAIEVVLLLATLIAIGPLVRSGRKFTTPVDAQLRTAAGASFNSGGLR